MATKLASWEWVYSIRFLQWCLSFVCCDLVNELLLCLYSESRDLIPPAIGLCLHEFEDVQFNVQLHN